MGGAISAWAWPIDLSQAYFLCMGHEKYQLRPGVHPHTVLHLLGDAVDDQPSRRVLYERMQKVLVLDQTDPFRLCMDEYVFHLITNMGGKVHSYVERTSDPFETRSIFFTTDGGFFMRGNANPSRIVAKTRDRLRVRPV